MTAVENQYGCKKYDSRPTRCTERLALDLLLVEDAPFGRQSNDKDRYNIAKKMFINKQCHTGLDGFFYCFCDMPKPPVKKSKWEKKLDELYDRPSGVKYV